MPPGSGASMKRLILMRHAKTEPWSEGIDDFGRALTPLGHSDARRMAEELVALSWSPEFCRTRARDPAHAVQCSGENVTTDTVCAKPVGSVWAGVERAQVDVVG